MPVRPGPQQDTQHPKMTSLENSQQEQDEAGNKQRPVIEPHENKSSEEPTDLLPLEEMKVEEEHYENVDEIYKDKGGFFTQIKPSVTEKVNHETKIENDAEIGDKGEVESDDPTGQDEGQIDAKEDKEQMGDEEKQKEEENKNDDLPQGWKRISVQRKKSAQMDYYIITDQKKRFRSQKKLNQWLKAENLINIMWGAAEIRVNLRPKFPTSRIDSQDEEDKKNPNLMAMTLKEGKKRKPEESTEDGMVPKEKRRKKTEEEDERRKSGTKEKIMKANTGKNGDKEKVEKDKRAVTQKGKVKKTEPRLKEEEKEEENERGGEADEAETEEGGEDVKARKENEGEGGKIDLKLEAKTGEVEEISQQMKEMIIIRKKEEESLKCDQFNEETKKRCGKTFATKRTRNVHNKAVHKKIRFSCNICQKPYKEQRSVNAHMRVKHSDGPVELLSCKQCKKEYKYKGNVSRHHCKYQNQK